jgi:hypothetical protein
MNRKSFQLVSGLALMLLGLHLVAAQTVQKGVSKPASPKIVAAKPGVFITFERFGKRTPVTEGEGTDGIWLRLHNNMRYPISFYIFGLSKNGYLPEKPEENTEIGLYYDVVMNPRSITDNRPLPVVPLGYPLLAAQEFELKAGRSLVFSVPKEHLAEELSIKISYSYSWEDTGEDNPTHFVYFNSFRLPK